MIHISFRCVCYALLKSEYYSSWRLAIAHRGNTVDSTCGVSIMVRFFSSLLVIVYLGVCSHTAGAATRPNLLLITVDDMSADSVGVFGSPVPDITPNIDKLAAQGIRFDRAHVQVANCMPSRNVMWSGRYPHSNRVEGFYSIPDPSYPTLADLAKRSGYFTAVYHKIKDSTPYIPYGWDTVLDASPAFSTRSPKDANSYALAVSEGIRGAKAAAKPFMLLINIADPHVPFFGLNRTGEKINDPFAPSREYSAKEITVPGFLVDDPVVRQELAHYYSSVRRADDAVGKIMKTLDESGESANTIVMFLSDHGMPFPFAKTQLYHQSTRTPLVFRWPGVIRPGSVDREHMVSAVDLLPTLLDSIGSEIPAGIQGRSLLSLLRGQTQEGRNHVFKAHNENAAGQRTPMRAVETPRLLYIFNPWSDGSRIMFSATTETRTHKRLTELAKVDERLADRLALLDHRVPEELYDIHRDPDCLNNLIDDPAYENEIRELRTVLEDWMRDTQDPALGAFVGRSDPRIREEFMQQQELATKERKAWINAIKERMKNSRAPTAEPT